jgi:hypothetical protein
MSTQRLQHSGLPGGILAARFRHGLCSNGCSSLWHALVHYLIKAGLTTATTYLVCRSGGTNCSRKGLVLAADLGRVGRDEEGQMLPQTL